MQRVNEASFFEVTTSRSCEDVNGFHNVTFGPGGKAIIYFCSVFRYDSWFQPLKAFSAFGSFSPVCRPCFWTGAGTWGKLRHVVYEVGLVSYLFFSFQIWYLRKWIFTSIGQGKHMRVTRFNPLWVSDGTQSIRSTISGRFVYSALGVRHAWISIATSIYFAYLPMRSFVHILIYLVVLGCQLMLVLISIHVQVLCKL